MASYVCSLSMKNIHKFGETNCPQHCNTKYMFLTQIYPRIMGLHLEQSQFRRQMQSKDIRRATAFGAKPIS